MIFQFLLLVDSLVLQFNRKILMSRVHIYKSVKGKIERRDENIENHRYFLRSKIDELYIKNDVPKMSIIRQRVNVKNIKLQFLRNY